MKIEDLAKENEALQSQRAEVKSMAQSWILRVGHGGIPIFESAEDEKQYNICTWQYRLLSSKINCNNAKILEMAWQPTLDPDEVSYSVPMQKES